jgi:hypothetical protein
MRSVFYSSLVLIPLCAPAMATDQGQVVASCPATLSTPYTVGQFGNIAIDVNGNMCGLPSSPTSAFPAGATPITAAAQGTTASTTATLAAVAGKTTYICGWSIDADATAAVVGNMTVTGTVGGTLTRRQGVANVTNGTDATWSAYSPCIPASAANTAISVNSAAAGTGGNTTVTAWGFQL